MSDQPETGTQPASVNRYQAQSMMMIAVAILVVIGVILIWTGQLIIAVSSAQTTASLRDVYRNSRIVTVVGAMISSAALFGGSIAAEKIDKFVRLGMVIAATLIVLGVMLFGLSYPYAYY